MEGRTGMTRSGARWSTVCITAVVQQDSLGDDQTLDDPKLSTAEVGENEGAN